MTKQLFQRQLERAVRNARGRGVSAAYLYESLQTAAQAVKAHVDDETAAEIDAEIKEVRDRELEL